MLPLDPAKMAETDEGSLPFGVAAMVGIAKTRPTHITYERILMSYLPEAALSQ
jgi:hypothetical protein